MHQTTRSSCASQFSLKSIRAHAVDYQSVPADLGLFLLPGGLPRLFVTVIQAGGRPRLLPRPRAIRSRTMIASSTCSRSVRNSASILLISISCKDSAREDPADLYC
jgi:hypothetical protein